jgi:hypothetical protein
MLVRILNNGAPYILLSSTAMLFIAVGAPLVHPAIHNHSGHEQADGAPCSDHFPAIAGADKGHACPICDFQAANQLHGGESEPIFAVDEPIDSISPTPSLSPVRAFPGKVKPRAPPRCS